MSLADDVKRVLREGMPGDAMMPSDTAEWGDANRDLYLMSVDRATVAIKNAVVLIAHEVDNLRAAVDELVNPPDAG